MAQRVIPFVGVIVGSPPDDLASSSKTADERVAKLWRLGIKLGDKEWRALWSPTRDELFRPATDQWHKDALKRRLVALTTAVKSFEKELAQRHAEALHPGGVCASAFAPLLERVRAGNYSPPPAGEHILPTRCMSR